MLVRGLAAEGTARVIAADVTELAWETASRHQLDPGATRLAAQALAANVLLAAHIKGEEELSVRLSLDDPSTEFLAQVTSEGVVRAKHLPSAVPWPAEGRVSGTLVAVKSVPGRELYRGATSVQDESLEEALSRHLSDSQQVQALLRLGTVDEPDGSLGFAGGILVERLPPEAGLQALDPATFLRRFAALAEGTPADHTVGAIYLRRLLGEEFVPLETRPLAWKCRCSRDRVAAMLQALGAAELRDLLEEQGEARVTCHFCNDEQVFDRDDLRALLAQF